MDLAEELGIDFAFPTRTLIIETRRSRGQVYPATLSKPFLAKDK
jgi:hypothetical protein